MSFFGDVFSQAADLHRKFDPMDRIGIKTPGRMIVDKLHPAKEEKEEKAAPKDNRPQFMQQAGGGGAPAQAGQNIRPAGQMDPSQGAYGNALRAWQGPTDPAGGAAPQGFTQPMSPDGGGWGASTRSNALRQPSTKPWGM